MPWLSVNHTRLCGFSAVPMPDFALDVQRGEIPGHPGAKRSFESLKISLSPHEQLCQIGANYTVRGVSSRNSRVCNRTVTLRGIEPRGIQITDGGITE